MSEIEGVQVYSMIVLIVWAIMFLTTVPLLVVAAHGHQRSTLMTMAIIGVLGLIGAILNFESARIAGDFQRPFELWFVYYAVRTASVLMAIVMGSRVWWLMLKPTPEQSVVASVAESVQQIVHAELQEQTEHVADVAAVLAQKNANQEESKGQIQP